MRMIPILVAILGMSVATVAADSPKTPYEAVVDVDEVFVRCGPGQDKYYPTGKLKRGDRVTVIRHDPGPWFVIVPPVGSFSWIPVEHVRREQGSRGIAVTNSFVRIGSEFAENVNDVRHRIAAGEEVEIIGEQTLQTDRGPVAMFKIKPIHHEYRYIPGQAVVAVNAVAARPAGVDPFSQQKTSAGSTTAVTTKPAPPKQSSWLEPIETDDDSANAVPSRGDTRAGSRNNQLVDRPLVRTRGSGSTRRSTAASEQFVSERQRLLQIDSEFRGTIQQETENWDLGRLEQAYAALRQQTASEFLVSEIDRRLLELDRWQKIQNEYQEFIHLTAETNRRDAQLLSIRQQRLQADAQAEGPPMSAPTPVMQRAAPTATQLTAGQPGSAPGVVQRPQVAQPSSSVPQPVPDPRMSQPAPMGSQIAQPHPTAPGHAVSPIAPRQPGLQPMGPQQVVPQQVAPQQRATQRAAPRQPARQQVAPQQTAPGQPPRFDGAGIVQRSATTYAGAPQHVLLAPNGRVLAYLHPGPGVDLDQYLGKPMGLFGQRGFRRELQADLIVVRGLMPVRLAP